MTDPIPGVPDSEPDVVLTLAGLPNWATVGGNARHADPQAKNRAMNEERERWMERLLAAGERLSPNARFVRGKVGYTVEFVIAKKQHPDEDNAQTALKALLDLLEPHRSVNVNRARDAGIGGTDATRGWLALILNDDQLFRLGPIVWTIDKERSPETVLSFWHYDSVEGAMAEASEAVGEENAQRRPGDPSAADPPPRVESEAGDLAGTAAEGVTERAQGSFGETRVSDEKQLKACEEFLELGERASEIRSKRKRIQEDLTTAFPESDYAGTVIRFLDQAGDPTAIALKPTSYDEKHRPAGTAAASYKLNIAKRRIRKERQGRMSV